MATAKAARTLKARGGGVIEIAADDAAFPLDLRSWCTSSKAELVSLQTSGEQHLAIVRIIGADAGLSTAPPLLAPAPEPSANVAPRSESLDCRGMQCPQPILTLSRLAKSLPAGTEVEVMADDDAFQLDVASWCRTSGATLLSIERRGAEFHARVRVVGARRRGTPAMPTPQIVTDPVSGPLSSSPSSSSSLSSSSLRMTSLLELRLDGPPSGWTARLDEVARSSQAGQRLRVLADNPELSREIVQWCAAHGHALLGLDTRGPVAAELELREPPPRAVTPPTTALAVREPDAVASSPHANRCTLLVLHNDQEALLAALLVAVGAAAQGREVVMFFTFWGLNLLRGDTPNENAPHQKVSWMQRMLKWMMPKGPKHQALGKLNFGGMGKQMLDMIMKRNNIMSLQQLLESAEEQGIRFIACTMSMQVMGITKRDLQPRSNLEYGGVAAFVEAAHGSGMSLVF